MSQSVGWRLSAGTDYDHGRENRDRTKHEDATFSGHSDERFAFLFSEDEKRFAYYHCPGIFCGTGWNYVYHADRWIN